MTKGLDALLGASLDVETKVYIPRLKTSFTIKALSNEDIRRCNERATVFGQRGEKSTDNQMLNALFIAKSCIDPDFNNKALKEHYGAIDEADCVVKALLPGEVTKLLQAVMELSGFGDEDEMVDEAKN
ncbi:hypothetical protein NYE48_27750 [Paenibacillus sp. FSL M7-1455]|uniref:phage tail assembly chaperone n=1 Tax=Paenibacillus sp. FSL M7-1455 TaxID=2975316 RepID=UPI0030F7CDE2